MSDRLTWNNSNLISVSLAIDHDQRDNRMAANVGIECPVCKQQLLDYDRKNIFTLVAWCRGCLTGLKQGS